MRIDLKRNLGVFLTIWAGILAGLPGAIAAPASGAKTNPPVHLNLKNAPLSRDVKLHTSLAPIIKSITPSVVNITSSTTLKGRNPLIEDPLFRRFFGEDDMPQPRSRKAESLGSGVIVSKEGYILTANHVIEGADKVKVSLADSDREYDARVVGGDPASDIAVLRIEPKQSLPAISIGDSDQLEVGDLVLAIGNPFGVGQTVTSGIVSGLGRGGLDITGYENFIQTDAAINPGNSGGALVDAEGRLVGINTAILSRSGGFQGVGFAVPVNMAVYVMEALIREGRVTRGYLGVNIQPLTADLASEFGLPDESSGVLIGGVSQDSAAEKAGVKDGDVVIEFNGKKVRDPRNLKLLVAQTPPGTKVTLKVLRTEGTKKPTEKTLTVKLAELPREFASRGPRGGQETHPNESGMDGLDGVEVADLDNRTRRQFDIPTDIKGALVTNVDPNSNSAEAGLRPGDVILEINRQAVTSAEEAVELSGKVKTPKVLVRVWGQGGGGKGTRYVVVDNTKH